MTLVDLFAGIGGFSLAGHWIGWETLLFCENAKFPKKVLAKNFPDILIHDDINNLTKEIIEKEFIKKYGYYDSKELIFTGGIPCQPASQAGKRKGTKDNRWLWDETIDLVRKVKPAVALFENVVGLISLENGKPFDWILTSLENEGYTVESFVIPACGVGAWHRRDRIWIISYDSSIGCMDGKSFKNTMDGRKQTLNEIASSSKIRKDVPNTNKFNGNKSGYGTGKISQFEASGLSGLQYWEFEPGLGGGFNGLPTWLHRHNIKGYNNEESIRRTEILRELWNNNVSQTIWKVIGGFDRIQKSEVLFAFVCEYEKNTDKARLFLESQKIFERFVRSLWMQGEITGSSYRPKNGKQFSGKYTDTMQELSRLLAYTGEENWQISSWEDAIPRVAENIPNRVDRLKGLGNSVVPQVVYEIFKAIEP